MAGKVIFLCSDSPRGRDAQIVRLLGEVRGTVVLCFDSPRTRNSFSREYDVVPIARPRFSPLRIVRRAVAAWFRASDAPPPEPAMLRALRDHASPGAVLWVSRFEMAPYIPLARRMGYRVIFDAHQAPSEARMEHAASGGLSRWHFALPAARAAWTEEKLCGTSHAVVAESEIAARKLERLAPGTLVRVIPSAVFAERFQPARPLQGRSLACVGVRDARDDEAAFRWLLTEILPRMKATLGASFPKLLIGSADLTPGLRERLQAAGAEFSGDKEQLLTDASVVIVPSGTGPGARLRILEAMAAGRAVVATGSAAEGLVLSPTYDAFVADRPDAFASAVLRLLREPELRDATGLRAAERVDREYDWSRVRPLVAELLEQVGA